MENKFELFKELIEFSQNERRGLTIFLKGQTVVGIVKKVIGTEAIEMSSQTYSRIIVRIDAIDGAAVG